MFSRKGNFRTCLSLLLAVVVPLCCCNFQSLLTACEACVPACAGHHGLTATANRHGQNDHEHGDSSGGRTESEDRHHHGEPSDGDIQDCTCGKHEAKMPSGEKPTIKLPTVILVAILNWVAMPPSAAGPSRPFSNGEIWTSFRPTTSLLRQHCALTV